MYDRPYIGVSIAVWCILLGPFEGVYVGQFGVDFHCLLLFMFNVAALQLTKMTEMYLESHEQCNR